MKSKEKKFEIFQKKVKNQLTRYIYTIARFDYHYAEDIFQLTMEYAWNKFDNLESDEKMLPWAYSISRTIARNFFSKHDNTGGYKVITKDMNDEEIINAHQSIDFTDEIISSENFKDILNKENPTTQQILYLHYFFGDKFKDIAQTLNMDYSNVRTIHARALKSLKKRMEETRDDG